MPLLSIDYTPHVHVHMYPHSYTMHNTRYHRPQAALVRWLDTRSIAKTQQICYDKEGLSVYFQNHERITKSWYYLGELIMKKRSENQQPQLSIRERGGRDRERERERERERDC